MSTLSLSPRWLSQLTSILAEHRQKAKNYALATVDTDGNAPVPRVRHHVHREILTTHPSRPLLLTTSDVRAPKVHQLVTHPSTKGPTAEVAWWIEPVVMQFRISARTHVLPAPSNKLHSKFPFGLLSSASGGDSGPESPSTPEEWEKVRIRTFNGLPGFLRASFARPTPGSPLANPDDANKWPTSLPESDKAETDEEKKHVKEALKNFSVLVLEPLAVDFVDLGARPNRRTKWELENGEWKSCELVP